MPDTSGTKTGAVVPGGVKGTFDWERGSGELRRESSLACVSPKLRVSERSRLAPAGGRVVWPGFQ